MAENKKKETEVAVKREAGSAPMVPGWDWDPFKSMRQQFDRLWQDFEWPDFRVGLPRRTFEHLRNWPEVSATIPAVDLVERDGGYEIQAELPGMNRDQIEIRLSDGMMTIKGEKSAEHVEDKENYHLRERSYGSFQRSFRIPAGVNADKVEARFENGVLKITLPKSSEALKKERKIEVKAS